MRESNRTSRYTFGDVTIRVRGLAAPDGVTRVNFTCEASGPRGEISTEIRTFYHFMAANEALKLYNALPE